MSNLTFQNEYVQLFLSFVFILFISFTLFLLFLYIVFIPTVVATSMFLFISPLYCLLSIILIFSFLLPSAYEDSILHILSNIEFMRSRNATVSLILVLFLFLSFQFNLIYSKTLLYFLVLDIPQ